MCRSMIPGISPLVAETYTEWLWFRRGTIEGPMTAVGLITTRSKEWLPWSMKSQAARSAIVFE